MRKNLVQREEARLEHWMVFYWQAWNALRYDRPFVGQTGIEMPIPYTAVDAYARRNGIDGEAFDKLFRFISEIDFAYLEVIAEERKANTPAK